MSKPKMLTRSAILCLLVLAALATSSPARAAVGDAVQDGAPEVGGMIEPRG